MARRSLDDEGGLDGRRPHKRYNEGPYPTLYQVFQGEVATVKDYGIFVKIPGTSRQGLVHKSQISKSKVDDASEMFAKGEVVYCKVITIDEDTEKIGLAMKMVNQTTGADQDPTNIELSEQRRRQGGSRPGRQRIELEAVLNTTCRRCGGTGHLAQDCYQTGEGSYELIPDLDEYMKSVGDTEKQTSRKHKHKKEKKKKKKRKRSQSSSSDGSVDHKSQKAKKKKHKQRAESSEDSDSDHGRKKHKLKKKGKHREDTASDSEGDHRSKKQKAKKKHKKRRHSSSSSDSSS